jgi:hypothetical protein
MYLSMQPISRSRFHDHTRDQLDEGMMMALKANWQGAPVALAGIEDPALETIGAYSLTTAKYSE